MLTPAQNPWTSSARAQFWQRATSKRQFIKTVAGASGLVFGSGLWTQALGKGQVPANAEPRPIPGGFEAFGELFHLFDPAPGNEPSSITDFNGFVGVARNTGFGTLTDATGSRRVSYDTDMRFMKGLYIGKDGRHRQGTFGFL